MKLYLLFVLVLLVVFTQCNTKKYPKPSLHANKMEVVNNLVPSIKASAHDDDDCECDGLKAITFKYNNYNLQHHTVKIVVVDEATPSNFEYIEQGDYFTVYGTYSDKNILGPEEITVKVFEHDADDDDYPIESHEFDVECPDTVKKGDKKGSIEVIRTMKHIDDCDDDDEQCVYSIALVVDVSGDVSDYEYTIKSLINDHVINYLAGSHYELAIYSFATNAYEDIYYTSLSTYSNVLAIKNAVSDMVFYKTAPTYYRNWEDGFNIVKSRKYPDLAIFITNGDPNVHYMSPYQQDDYEDDIAASIIAANALKSVGTKIMPIVVGNECTVANVQAISGPKLNHDYIIAPDYDSLTPYLYHSLYGVCCEDDKDECGVCFGDNSSCVGCDDVPNSGKEYDVCGVCDGDGTTCVAPPCVHDFNVTVTEYTSFDIEDHYNTFEFKYHTNYFENTAVILGFEPFEECNIRERDTCANRPDTPYQDYKDLFTVDFDSNGWTKEINEDELTVYYSRNFTLYDLLDCKDADENGPLITISDDKTHYQGYLYGAVVRANNLHNEHECETILFQTKYKFEIWVQTEGVLSSIIMVSPVEFTGEWIRNIWLQSGDVIVEFETHINHIEQDDDDDQTTKLGDAQILVEQETGVPFHLIYVDSECEAHDDEDKKCKQIWQIRTYDAIGVLDFSGFKPIQFTVFVDGYPRTTVILNLHLTIHRSNDPKVDNMLGATLELFHDRDLKCLYDPSDNYKSSFIDCSDIFGKVSFHNKTVSVHLDQIFLCTGSSGDPLPYDPSYPHTTGCNTPGIDKTVITLYDKDTGQSNTMFDFDFIQDPPQGPSEIGFKYQARILSNHKQLLQVHWKAELIDHYFDDDGNVKLHLLEGVTSNFHNQRKELQQTLINQHQNYETHQFLYPRIYYQKPLARTLQKESFYDFYDYAASSNVGYSPYYVTCADGYVWYGNSCINTYHSYAYTYGSNYILWLFLLFVIIMIFACYCYAVPYNNHYTHPAPKHYYNSNYYTHHHNQLHYN